MQNTDITVRSVRNSEPECPGATIPASATLSCISGPIISVRRDHDWTGVVRKWRVRRRLLFFSPPRESSAVPSRHEIASY